MFRPNLVASALLCLLVLVCESVFAGEKLDSIDLSQAIALTLDRHPDLKVFPVKRQSLNAQRQTAALRPVMELGVEAENFAGSFEDGRGEAEYTLSLSSSIELGGKRDSRLALIDARTGYVESQREALTLNLLGELTQQFILVVSTQEKIKLAEEAVFLAKTTFQTVKKRVAAGAASDADSLRANASLTEARIRLQALKTNLNIEMIALATFWGGVRVPENVQGNLYRFSPIDDLESLYQRILNNPALHIFASEERVQEAEVQLARSQAKPDMRWQFGFRQFTDNGDTGVVAGFSIPLSGATRNRGVVQAARAEQMEISLKKASTTIQLHSKLERAYLLRQQAITTVEQYQNSALPDLVLAMEQIRQAYENGRYAYLEWLAVQEELLEAKQALIEAATQAQLYGAVIEQLTGEKLTGEKL